jgi:hypothetical protein
MPGAYCEKVMMQTEFINKLERIRLRKNSDLALLIRPRLSNMPLPLKRHDDPFLPFAKEIIMATQDIVVAYVFDLAAYLALGAAGAIALERTVNYAASDSLLILHGPFSTPQYATITDEQAFPCDAVTLSDSQHIELYLKRPDRSAFVLNNRSVQHLDAPDNGGYLWVQTGALSTIGLTGEVITLRLFGDDVIYASSGDDFVIRARETLEDLNDSVTG